MNEHRDTEKHYGGGPNRPDLCGLVIPGRRGRLLGTLYTAAGEGLHPVVLLLHGIPGNEQNADLAQALRRAGNPDEIVGAALYFASAASSFTTGAILRVDGGRP